MRTKQRCARCRRVLPARTFRTNPKMRSGLNSWCKACAVARMRQWRVEHPEAVAASNAARREGPWPRTCAGCGEKSAGNRRNARWCATCRPRRRSLGRALAGA